MNSKRTHLSLEIKHFIVLEKKRRPKISQTELVWEVNRKFGVSTSRRAFRTALNSKTSSRLLWKMLQKRVTNEPELSRSDFESLLDSTLKKNFVKWNLNADVAIYQERVGKDQFYIGIWLGRAIVGKGCRGRISACKLQLTNWRCLKMVIRSLRMRNKTKIL